MEAGIESGRVTSSDEVIDPKDVVFYEVAMSKDNSYLVTGNTKHFPAIRRVVTPNEMLEILNSLDNEQPSTLTFKYLGVLLRASTIRFIFLSKNQCFLRDK